MNSETRKLRIGVLFGGRSGEHEVSLRSARSVLAALDRSKYSVFEVGITHEGTWLVGEGVLDALASGKTSGASLAACLPDPTNAGLYALQGDSGDEHLTLVTDLDVVFPVLHGTYGEDGTLQGLLEMAGLPYVGAGVLGSSVGMDKGIFKDVMVANRIPVLDTLVFLRSDIEGDLDQVLDHAEAVAPYPLFVKPANMGSSVGVTKCQGRSDLVEGLVDAAQYDRRILVQRGIDAREIEVSILGNDNPEASVPGEVVPSREFYSYEAKYIDDQSELLIPAPISESLTAYIRDLAVRAYKAIDCAGMARVDFFLDKHTEEIYLGEVNTLPGFTSISMYPKLWEASGLPYPQLLDRLIELALERKSDRDRTNWRYQ